MTPQLEEAILQAVEDDPSTSTRRLSLQFNISHESVRRVLHTNLLYPFHIQRVQALLPTDFPARLEFCQWLLQKTAQNPNFKAKILFTDEASFSREAIRNFHNNHLWDFKNPHAIGEGGFQQQFSVNVWAGIIGDHLIGPHFLPPRLNGDTYRQFLEEILPGLLEDVPLATRNTMWFMHDGAPAHFSLVARNYLNDAFAQQ